MNLNLRARTQLAGGQAPARQGRRVRLGPAGLPERGRDRQPLALLPRLTARKAAIAGGSAVAVGALDGARQLHA